MALPPSNEINETFLKEVDENLRRDRTSEFARKNARWFILAIVLFLAAAGGAIFWQERQKATSERESEQLADVYRELGTGKFDKAPAQLDALAKSSSPAIRASALFTRAAIALEKNDRDLALAKYKEILADSALPKPDRDAALIRQTAMEFDSLKPDDVIARLKPLATPGNAFYGSAGEMTAVALIKQGKTKEAGRIFAAIAANDNVPQSLRARAVQIAGSLGADASDSLDQVR